MTSRNLVVIPERGVQLVPNIGDRWRALPARRGHRDGPRNTRKVLDYAGGRAGSGRLYLTTSHFRRPPSWRARTDHPDVVYGDSNDVDLGRRVVHIRATDRAHSKGAVRAHITQPPPSHR